MTVLRSAQDRIRVMCGWLVVKLIHDDDVQSRDDKNHVGTRAFSRISARRRSPTKVDPAVFHPPEVSIPSKRHVPKVDHFVGVSALLNPCFGNDLPPLPTTLTQVEKAETRHVPGCHFKHVRRMHRNTFISHVIHVARTEILHAGRLCNPSVKRITNLKAGLLLKDRTENVEIPVVVEPEGAPCVAAACGTVLALKVGLKS